MYLLEVHNGLFNTPFLPIASQHDGWRLITPCRANLPQVDEAGATPGYTLEQVSKICPLLYEAGDFDEKNYTIFRLLLAKLLRFASAGHTWKAMSDDVHDSGNVTITRMNGAQETHTIIQFGKKKTLVRIHAMTTATGRKVAFLSHAFVKPANARKTPSSQQNRAGKNLEAYLNAIDGNTAQLIDIQGGRNGFLKLV